MCNTQMVPREKKMKPSSPKSSTTKLLTVSLFFASLTLFLLSSSKLKLPYHRGANVRRSGNSKEKEYYLSMTNVVSHKPKWFDFIKDDIKVVPRKNQRKNMIKFGLVNVNEEEVRGLGDSLYVHFDRVKRDDVKWDDLFPEWIDEDEKWGPPACPRIPMPVFDNYEEVDVVVARVPCDEGMVRNDGKGVRDVFRLQVNLVVANLLVKNNVSVRGDFDRTVYVVFIGACGAMLEIFRCDDLVWNDNEYWVYKPHLGNLKQKVAMPVGSCQIAPPVFSSGKETRRRYKHHSAKNASNAASTYEKTREAYVTLLHSSNKYVCGAIALAQSIIQTKTTRDLMILVDDSIKTRSLHGLRSAGWKIKKIGRIRSPHAKEGAYNEWNYSKLRIFQLSEYDKIIFIDADLIVLRNMDELFAYPQMSATGNDGNLFNSGVMAVEPSECTFKLLTAKRDTVASYNGGDQGFLNEVFTWWHRWPKKVNSLKMFHHDEENPRHEISADLHAIHYLGLKPWMCYRDYDCNWDTPDHHIFASDTAHERWWQVYDAMPKKLQGFCGLTQRMDFKIKKRREMAANASLPDGHWKIKAKDPRQHNII